jgi:hypothetical protein
MSRSEADMQGQDRDSSDWGGCVEGGQKKFGEPSNRSAWQTSVSSRQSLLWCEDWTFRCFQSCVSLDHIIFLACPTVRLAAFPVQLSIPINISREGERRGSIRSVIQTTFVPSPSRSQFVDLFSGFCLYCLWDRGCQGKRRDHGPTFVPSWRQNSHVSLPVWSAVRCWANWAAVSKKREHSLWMYCVQMFRQLDKLSELLVAVFASPRVSIGCFHEDHRDRVDKIRRFGSSC